MEPKKATNDECLILLQAAVPEIYRGNAFRISGLSVNATTREITTQMQKNQLMEKYGNKTISTETPFPIVPAPDTDQHRLALHRLREPETRILDEFFWFWPHDFEMANSDKALGFLSNKDIAAAEKTWIEYENMLTESNVSRHNLAILSHLQILDDELSGYPQKKPETANLEQQWVKTFKRWKLLIDHEGFWHKFSERIIQLDDPRMTTSFVQEFRGSLPMALLLINANLALKAAEKQDSQTAKRHLELILNSEFGKEAGDVALRKTVEPIRNRIKITTKSFTNEKYPNHVGELEASQKLIDQTKPLLEILDILLPANNSLREVAHDEVSLEAMYLVNSATNASEEYEKALPIYEQLISIVKGESAKQKVNGNLKIYISNIEYDKLYNTCFFCEKNKSDESHVVKIKMCGNVRKVVDIGGREYPYMPGIYGSYSVKWSHNTIEVPRCPNCKKEHDLYNKTEKERNSILEKNSQVNEKILVNIFGGFIFSLGLSLFAFFGILELGFEHLDFWLYFTFLNFAALGMLIGYIFSPQKIKMDMVEIHTLTTKEYVYYLQYPKIVELREKGWQYGEKPIEAR